MTEDLKIKLLFTLYLLVFGLPLYGLYKLPAAIRSLRMKKLAKKYGLKYERMIGLIKFEMTHSGKEKRNRISGKINNNEIEIFDYISTSNPWKTAHTFNEYHTVFIKDGEKQDVIGVWGYIRIGTVNNWLNLILTKNEVGKIKKKFEIQDPHKIFLKHALYLLLILVILLLLIDPNIFNLIFETLFESTKISISENFWYRFKFFLIVSILISGLIKYVSSKKSKSNDNILKNENKN